MVTDSERFYSSILDLLEDVDEQEDVNALLVWWNRFVSSPHPIKTWTHAAQLSRIFPTYSSAKRIVPENSAYAKIKARRAALKNAARTPGPG
jgi:hypothetical protein